MFVPVHKLMDLLQKIDGYPFDRSKDYPFLDELMDEFPLVNLYEELIRLRLWLSECKPYPGLHYRLFLRRWVQNASNRISQKPTSINQMKPEPEGENSPEKNEPSDENKLQNHKINPKHQTKLS